MTREYRTAAAKRDLGDFMVFTIRPDDRHPDIQNNEMQYDGVRFRAECSLAGKLYGRPFGVDVAFGDPILGEPEVIVAEDALAFAGLAPPTLRVYPVETHIAEKLHAYTMPRARPNSRVKDLPDVALIATVGSVEASRLRAAIDQTFAFRGTHDVPEQLPAPPPRGRGPTRSSRRKTSCRGPRSMRRSRPLAHSSTPCWLVSQTADGTRRAGRGPETRKPQRGHTRTDRSKTRFRNSCHGRR